MREPTIRSKRKESKAPISSALNGTSLDVDDGLREVCGGNGAAKPVGSSISFGRLVLVVWAVGCLLLLLRMIHGWTLVRRLCSTAAREDSPKVAEAIALVENRQGKKLNCQVLCSDRIGTAFATGLWRPMIIVPSGYVESLTSRELSFVLTHESAHLVRRDLAVGVFQRLAAIVFWPHPLLHLLNRWLSRAREETCDNIVNNTGGFEGGL